MIYGCTVALVFLVGWFVALNVGVLIGRGQR